MKHYNYKDTFGKVIKDTEQYQLVDDSESLTHLVISKTVLHPGKRTNGHTHTDQEEVYFFKSGKGIMIVGEEQVEVHSGDIIPIPLNHFHAVINTGEIDLEFVCVFEGSRNH